MPQQISIYVDNENYVKFLQLSDEERTRIRKEAQLILIEEINKIKSGEEK